MGFGFNNLLFPGSIRWKFLHEMFVCFTYKKIQYNTSRSAWGCICTKCQTPAGNVGRVVMFLPPLLVKVVHWLFEVLCMVDWEQCTVLYDEPQTLQCIKYQQQLPHFFFCCKHCFNAGLEYLGKLANNNSHHF